MIASARRQLATLREELNPAGAPPARWRDLSFFFGTAVALIGTRYYGRMANWADYSEHLAWIPKLVAALGGSGGGLEAAVFWALMAIVLRFALPVVLALGVARVDRTQVGLRCVQDRGLALQAMATMAVGIVGSFALAQVGMLEHLPLVEEARTGGANFWIYEVAMVAQLLATGYLFFGYLLLGTERVLGPEAVVVTALAFALNYGYRSGLEVGLIFVAALALGHLTLRGRSVGPTLVVMTVVAVARDLIGLAQHLEGGLF